MYYREDVRNMSVAEVQLLATKGASFVMADGTTEVGDGTSGSYIKLKGHPTRVSARELVSKMAWRNPRKNPNPLQVQPIDKSVKKDIVKIAQYFHKEMSDATKAEFEQRHRITPSMVRYLSNHILAQKNIIGVSTDGRRLLIQEGDTIVKKTFVVHAFKKMVPRVSLGFKDCNGVDIFTGDTIRDSNGVLGVVSYGKYYQLGAGSENPKHGFHANVYGIHEHEVHQFKLQVVKYK